MSNYKIVWTPEKKEAAIQKISKYLEQYGSGECICQNDDALIYASDVFSDIADNILIEGEGLVWEE